MLLPLFFRSKDQTRRSEVRPQAAHPVGDGARIRGNGKAQVHAPEAKISRIQGPLEAGQGLMELCYCPLWLKSSNVTLAAAYTHASGHTGLQTQVHEHAQAPIHTHSCAQAHTHTTLGPFPLLLLHLALEAQPGLYHCQKHSGLPISGTWTPRTAFWRRQRSSLSPP